VSASPPPEQLLKFTAELYVWLSQCTKSTPLGEVAFIMAKTIGIFTGVKADMRKGTGMASLETGWVQASSVDLQSHSS